MEIKEDWKTILLRSKDKVFRLADKLYKCSSIDDDEKKNIKSSGSTPGKMYGMPKIEKMKDNVVPLRPILRSLGTHIYNLSIF